MKKGSTLFLKTVIFLIAVAVLVGLIWEPQLEGVNANADLVTIYFKDPFLAYVYLGSIPFFVALYQAFKLLGYIEHNKAFSQTAVNALRNIKHCALILIAAIIGALVFIRFASGSDDPAGAIALGICVTFASIVIASATALFEKQLQNAVNLKAENDLTV